MIDPSYPTTLVLSNGDVTFLSVSLEKQLVLQVYDHQEESPTSDIPLISAKLTKQEAEQLSYLLTSFAERLP